MSEKPRLLVIERETSAPCETWAFLEERYEVVRVRSVAQAIAVLRDRPVVGVFVDAMQLPAVRWIGMLLQADEILDAIADGVAVVGPDRDIIWANPEFLQLCGPGREAIGAPIADVLGGCEPVPLADDPFAAAAAARQPADAVCKVPPNCYMRITVTPIFNTRGALTHQIVLTRDVTAEVLQQQKIDAIHRAGEELADLTPEDLAELGVEERKDLLKLNIVRHMKDLLGLDFLQVRLLEPGTERLVPLLTEGMPPRAAERELFAREEGNGVTGFVAATGLSYLCPDTAHDPLYIEGAVGARSALTVPLVHHGNVIGTLNVESPQPAAFDERDRQFVEIYARGIAASLNTLELLDAEKRQVASASVEAMSRELALPLDDILSDATTVLDRYGGHDEEIVARLKHLLARAREIRGLIPKVGSALAPEARPRTEPPRLAGARLLVVDADEAIRRAAHTLLGREGAIVETARDAREALALTRQSPYTAALVDIRLPDMTGYEIYRQLREIQPGLPVILMTGFGYDPTHAIVKARQDGLKTVLYKPFRADRLIESVDQALRGATRDASPRAMPAARSDAAAEIEGRRA